VLIRPYPYQEGNKLQRQKILIFIYPIYNHNWKNISKVKKSRLQASSGPECFRKLRFPDFMKTAQDGVKVVSLTHRPPLTPGNTPGTHVC